MFKITAEEKRFILRRRKHALGRSISKNTVERVLIKTLGLGDDSIVQMIKTENNYDYGLKGILYDFRINVPKDSGIKVSRQHQPLINAFMRYSKRHLPSVSINEPYLKPSYIDGKDYYGYDGEVILFT